MSVSKHKKIQDEIKESMRARDTIRLSVLRGLLAAFTNELVAQRRKPNEELSDDEVLAVIKKQAKQRKDSIEQFEKGGRNDLVEKEQAELVILKEYLPEEMSREEVEKIVLAKKEELDIADKSKIGVLIGAVMKELKGRSDGALVKEVTENILDE
jgi:uncharacterized protein